MNTIKAFFQIIRAIFSIFKNGQLRSSHLKVRQRPSGNLSIGISALAIASASAFKYKHCLLHSCKCLVLTDQSQSFQQSYNILYKRNNSDTSKKVFQNIKEGILQSSYLIIPVVEFVFNKIAGNELQTQVFAEKKFPPRRNFQCFFSQV